MPRVAADTGLGRKWSLHRCAWMILGTSTPFQGFEWCWEVYSWLVLSCVVLISVNCVCAGIERAVLLNVLLSASHDWRNNRSLYTVGYSGGKELDPTYRSIKDHTESVLIEFNPNVISYENLLIEVRTHVDAIITSLLEQRKIHSSRYPSNHQVVSNAFTYATNKYAISFGCVLFEWGAKGDGQGDCQWHQGGCGKP
jgi:hypothetical protein